MGRSKDTWISRLECVGIFPEGVYREGTWVGTTTNVQVVLQVTAGREKGREVRVVMTPDEIDVFAKKLQDTAKTARENDLLWN